MTETKMNRLISLSVDEFDAYRREQYKKLKTLEDNGSLWDPERRFEQTENCMFYGSNQPLSYIADGIITHIFLVEEERANNGIYDIYDNWENYVKPYNYKEPFEPAELWDSTWDI